MPRIWTFETLFLLPGQEWEVERLNPEHYNPMVVTDEQWAQMKHSPKYLTDAEYTAIRQLYEARI
jgi:hypothetical protein